MVNTEQKPTFTNSILLIHEKFGKNSIHEFLGLRGRIKRAERA